MGGGVGRVNRSILRGSGSGSLCVTQKEWGWGFVEVSVSLFLLPKEVHGVTTLSVTVPVLLTLCIRGGDKFGYSREVQGVRLSVDR